MQFKLSSVAAALLLANSVSLQADDDTGNNPENDEKITILGQVLSVNEVNSVKSPTPVIDVPQSLSIFTAEELTARGISAISQIIDYTPGLNTSQGEGHRDSVVFRGIRSTADFYQDGNRDDVQYYRALYNVEKVEILRGPNALLFGRGGTGGIINRVSKKPVTGEEFTGVKASIDYYGGFSTEVDTNVSEDDRSAFRINAMVETLENHRDFYDGDRQGFNPTFRYEFSDETVLDLSYEYINHERFIDRGIPTGDDGRPVENLDYIVFGDPDNNYHTLEANVVRANLQNQFSDTFKGNFSLFYGDFDKVYANFYASNYDEATRIVELDGYIDTTQRQNLILSTNLIKEATFADLNHTIIWGVEYISTSSNQDRFNPVFDSTNGDRESFRVNRPLNFRGLSGVNSDGVAVTAAFSDLNDATDVDLSVTSFYIQDEIEISKNLDIVLGARFDSFDITVFNADPDVRETRKRTDEEISPRAGLVFKPEENISLYLSYSESFLPRSGEQYANINGSNNQLDPNTFANQEVGIKWDLDNGLGFTAAFFENEQSSPQVADSDPSTLDVIDSDISGFEMTLSGQLTDDWYLTANYSNLDGEIVDRSGPTGRTPRELPENTFSIWNTYMISDDFGIGFGATYQGESFINTSNSAVLPSYTRFDAAAYYDLSPSWRIQLNVENLTDELYFPNAHSTHQVTVGSPVNARLSIIGTFE